MEADNDGGLSFDQLNATAMFHIQISAAMWSLDNSILFSKCIHSSYNIIQYNNIEDTQTAIVALEDSWLRSSSMLFSIWLIGLVWEEQWESVTRCWTDLLFCLHVGLSICFWIYMYMYLYVL